VAVFNEASEVEESGWFPGVDESIRRRNWDVYMGMRPLKVMGVF
jgi:hypothetical protein